MAIRCYYCEETEGRLNTAWSTGFVSANQVGDVRLSVQFDSMTEPEQRAILLNLLAAVVRDGDNTICMPGVALMSIGVPRATLVDHLKRLAVEVRKGF